MCNNLQRLNAISEFNSYRLHRVDGLIERLAGAWFISTLDLTNGYWQVALTPAARLKTAFSDVPEADGHRVEASQAEAYLDDTIIHSATWADHTYHLEEVLSKLVIEVN